MLNGRTGRNSARRVGLALRGRSPRASGLKLMRAVAGSAAELEVVKDEEALPSRHPVMFVSLTMSAR
jgi:hypothetical protein